MLTEYSAIDPEMDADGVSDGARYNGISEAAF